MKNLLLIVLLVLIGCQSMVDKHRNENIVDRVDTISISGATNDTVVPIEETTPEMIADYYIVIIDTGMEYFPLQRKMYDVSKRYKLKIDTMGRYFDLKKNEIVLREDDPDEIYAGQYFFRRYPEESLSLEYLNSYQEKSREKTIALVAGIYEKEVDAEAMVVKLRNSELKSYRLLSKVYTGCIH